MVTADIEREIQQENKIFMGLSVRKAIVCVVAIVICIVLTVFLTFEISIYPCIGVAILVYFFGWFKKDGLTFEKYLMKIIKEKLYHNNVRKYRTKNKYISLMNNEYNRHKNIDMSNKQVAKQIKKESKKQAKTSKKAKVSKLQTID